MVYLVAFAFLGVYVALMRDTIQIVRAFGDVMRVLLGVSLALEVLSGILLDVPITILGIQGDLAELGPIQGIFGSRNLLGFVALIALLTFIVEWRTRIVQRGRAIGSIVLASLCIVLVGLADHVVGARRRPRRPRRALRAAPRRTRRRAGAGRSRCSSPRVAVARHRRGSSASASSSCSTPAPSSTCASTSGGSSRAT